MCISAPLDAFEHDFVLENMESGLFILCKIWKAMLPTAPRSAVGKVKTKKNGRSDQSFGKARSDLVITMMAFDNASILSSPSPHP